MYTKIYFSLIFFLCTLVLTAQENETILSEVMEVLNAQEKAWNANDLEGFMEGYWRAEHLVFVGRNGPSYGWEQTLENYKIGYPTPEAMGQLHFDVLNTEVWDEQTVHMVGKFTLKRKTDQPQGYFSVLWRKMDGVWRIVSDHSSASTA